MFFKRSNMFKTYLQISLQPPFPQRAHPPRKRQPPLPLPPLFQTLNIASPRAPSQNSPRIPPSANADTVSKYGRNNVNTPSTAAPTVAPTAHPTSGQTVKDAAATIPSCGKNGSTTRPGSD
ncbi:hypothetical protein DID88_004921 [Monilinia fructigena]|uniref:Uncharacterized protein n=1 Tax=Monilinia fructigena TaxID=38457 RepID=A0A395IPW7_9HELO|nr:hypothetical protein DID88_004921 [Monilinia fructigena]